MKHPVEQTTFLHRKRTNQRQRRRFWSSRIILFHNWKLMEKRRRKLWNLKLPKKQWQKTRNKANLKNRDTKAMDLVARRSWKWLSRWLIRKRTRNKILKLTWLENTGMRLWHRLSLAFQMWMLWIKIQGINDWTNRLQTQKYTFQGRIIIRGW
jgi:hypothetical protein